MAASTEFDSLLWQTVQISTRTGHTQRGVPTFSTDASTFNAQWEPNPHEVRDDRGNVVEAQGTLIVMSTGGFGPQAKVTLPDGSNAPILSIARVPGATGVHHLEIELGWSVG